MKLKFILFSHLIFWSLLQPVAELKAQIDPGIPFDLNTYINKRLDAGEKYIVVPPGRYRVPERNNYHLNFDGRNDVTIIADGVEMICTETVQAIKIQNCNNFKLRGISVDYDPLPYTQARIVALSQDKRTITADFIAGYSSTVVNDKLEIYDPQTGELVTMTYYNITYTVDEVARRVVIRKPSNYGVSTSLEKVGDIVVVDSRSAKRIPHAIVMDGCNGLVFENVTVYSGPTFAFFETYCNGSKYIKCKVDVRPIATDIKQRGVRRMRSNNADGFHSKHARIGPSYVECISRYNGDDGIAINGDYHIVTESDGSKLRVIGKFGRLPNLTVGDSVELVTYIGKRLPNSKIIQIEAGPELTEEERQFLKAQPFNGDLLDMYLAPRVYYVTLSSPVFLPLGSLIASASRIGNGFEVKDCIMGPNRSRGILVKSSNGTITGNTLTDNWGQAIKLSPEYNWLEAGSGSNIVVSNNVIKGCRDVSIAVYAYGGNGKVAPIGAHDNVEITGNSITGSTNPGIAITSTSNYKLSGNTIASPNNTLLLPWLRSEFGRNQDATRQIYLNNFEYIDVKGVTINNCPPAGLQIGATVELTQTVTPVNAFDKSTSWSSDNLLVATVSIEGKITALAAGSAKIKLKSNDSGITSECVVNVLPEPIVLSVRESEKELSVYPNPSQGTVNFQGFEMGEKIEIYSTNGRFIKSFVYDKPLQMNLPKGFFLIKTSQKNYKLIVE